MSDIGSVLGKAAQGMASGASLGAAAGPVGAGAGAAIGLALQLAPQISKWIIGDDGGTAARVAQTVQSVVGLSPPAQAADLDPAVRTNLALELARIAADREAAHDQARNDELAQQMADIASARARDVALRAGGGQNVRADVMLLAVTVGILACIISAATGKLGDTAVFGLVSGIAGMLTGCFKDAFTFEFGSSRQSENKTNIIADMARTPRLPASPPAQVVRAPAAFAPSPAPVVVVQPSPPPPPIADPLPVVVTNPDPVPEPIAPVIIAQPPPVVVTPRPDRKAFFDAIRPWIFGGRLVHGQVDGCEKILDFWNATYPSSDVRWLAYVLATATWETGRSMQPVEEVGRGAGHAYGNTPYFGRGLVQLTHEDNYRRMSPVAGVDLVAHPEMALEWPVSLRVLFTGMIDGMFTGSKLGDYFSAAVDDPISARAIVNGNDKAHEIAAFHRVFLDALKGEASPGERTV